MEEKSVRHFRGGPPLSPAQPRELPSPGFRSRSLFLLVPASAQVHTLFRKGSVPLQVAGCGSRLFTLAPMNTG